MRYVPELYFKSAEEMRALFPEHPEAISNTVAIAERCELKLEFGTSKFPEYEPPAGKTRRQYLRELCAEGMRKRFGDRATTDAELRRPPQQGARRHREDRLRQLFSDRLGLHPFRERTWHSGRPGTWFRRRFAHRLRARNYRHRSASVRFAVRALPQSRSRFAPGYRCRLLRIAARRGARIRPPKIRRAARFADHHLRKTESKKRGARCRPRHGPELRRLRPDREDDP